MQADPQVDAPLIVASLSILLTLASSLALWIRHIQKSDSIIEQDTGHSRVASRLGQLRHLCLRDDYFHLCGADRSESSFF